MSTIFSGPISRQSLLNLAIAEDSPARRGGLGTGPKQMGPSILVSGFLQYSYALKLDLAGSICAGQNLVYTDFRLLGLWNLAKSWIWGVPVVSPRSSCAETVSAPRCFHYSTYSVSVIFGLLSVTINPFDLFGMQIN